MTSPKIKPVVRDVSLVLITILMRIRPEN